MTDSKLKAFISKDSTRTRTFVSELFKKTPWYIELRGAPEAAQRSELVDPQPSKQISVQHEKPVQKPIKQSSIEEKNKSGEEVDSFAQARIKLNPLSDIESMGQSKSESFNFDHDFYGLLSSISKEWSQDSISGSDTFDKSVDVLFLGLDTIDEEFIPETAPFSLLESSQDLLGKMIMAMGLKEGQFVRAPLIKIGDPYENFIQTIVHFRPKVVIPLGATATNIALKKKLKLSNVHGQISGQSVTVNSEEFTFNICPLFHPELLEINPNMKRAAWIDMQKVMTFLSE